MMYRYEAYTQDKKIVDGMIDATSEALAEETLYRAGYQYILSLKSVGKRQTAASLLPTLFGVRVQDVIDFSRQLASFVESGVALPTVLQLLEEQTKKPSFKSIIVEIIQELQGGSSFSQAISKYPDIFPYYYVQIIKASEQAGEMESGLRQVADYMEKQAKVKSSIIRASTYPAIIIIMAIGVFALLITVVLPPIYRLYSSLGVSLPLITRIIMSVARLFTDYGLYILVGIVALIVIVVLYARSAAGKPSVDGIILRLPMLGNVILWRAMGQFCQTSFMLMHAGIQLPAIMDVAIHTVGNNRVITRALIEVRDKLVEGEGLSRPMSENPLFPNTMTKMVAMGEQTGNIDSTLKTLANYYEERANQSVQSLIAMIEPVLTAVVGIGVAFILFSTILPLYSILGKLR